MKNYFVAIIIASAVAISVVLISESQYFHGCQSPAHMDNSLRHDC